MSITFIWIGILILKDPQAWGGYVQPWVVKMLPVSVEQALLSTAILDILIGILFLIDWFSWVAGIVATLHLAVVLTVSGITDITVRDIGLLAATIVIMLEDLPLHIKNKFNFLN
ncbi:MAG: hypothetical protein A3D34_03440 [Candidatus Staskawiczbacteria bacterium RIFCSPHIGHO2_02_FULL_33_16]|uniref:DoxX family protein n=1 Tax=Candidatus Staskawiczbacteria bacterium RIFCSPHIGHO2_02_FULL_33_16 TaxID=1802204 RepID=A0A1G2HU12_9BACT|nr:MAG: hypothetical protein A3D34_03440 [Candidatus Staskawiczbacteria bacterium RIFCSPHIGHO2_02_FULL_33_16]OGZ70284.1 MAG: hypothetical protein A2980_01930 [Candidatus Staskawiczbacteria bacterium RIFCSPLOWO2_01_FULL_33_13]